jgi:predicted ATPase
VLEAASLAGQEFSAATVAAALATDIIPIEQQCGRLADQQHFLRRVGLNEWPDGTRAERYGFQHALYQEFWYERVSVGQQQQWHLRMGERKELAYGQRVREIAAELALHFEQGQDYRRAIRYLQIAGENAARRNAHQEAITHFTQGLALLKTLPDTQERARQELALQFPLGAAMMAIRGYTSLDVEKVYAQTQVICQQLGETSRFITVLWSQVVFYNNRGQLQKGYALAEEMVRLAQSVQDQYLLSKAHGVLG